MNKQVVKTHPTLNIDVSYDGRVKVSNDAEWNPGMNDGGKLSVRIGNHRYSIHRIVAETFIPNPNNLPNVLHIDGDFRNNRVDNLTYGVRGGLKARRLDIDTALSIASKYDKVIDLVKNDASVYDVLWKNGLVDKVFPNRVKKMTLEECKKRAAECSTLAEFRRKYPNTYMKCKKDKTLWELGFPDTADVLLNSREMRLSDEKIWEAAQQYRTINDFRTKNPRMYDRAVRHGLIGKMTFLSRNKHLDNARYSDAVYVYEFPSHNTAYVGRTVSISQRDSAHRSCGDKVRDYADSIGEPVPPVRIMHSGLTPEDGAYMEISEIARYRESGWIMLNEKSGGGLGGLERITKEECFRIARQFTDYTEFRKQHQYIADKMRRNGWIGECDWLMRRRRPAGTWTDKENCRAEASRFGSRNEMRLHSRVAYEVCKRNGWDDEFFDEPSRPTARKVVRLSRSGKVYRRYDSLKEAAAACGTFPQTVSAICRKVMKSWKGIVFRYADDV